MGYQELFSFSSWFYSKKLEEAATDVGADLIGMVKTNTKVFKKETIENLTKGLARRFLPPVENKAYVTQGKAANCYWLQVYYVEGSLFYCYRLLW